MGYDQGKKAAERLLAFAQSATAKGASPIEQIARTLMKRPLGEKHLQQISAFFQAAEASALLKIYSNFTDNKGARLEDRHVIQSVLYMGMHRTRNGNIAYNDYIPFAMDGRVSTTSVSFFARPFPLCLSSQHTEFRFVEQGSRALDYSSVDFRFSMVIGLALARILGSIMPGKGLNTTPVPIPHKNGFFLGHAVMQHHDKFYPSTAVIAKRPPNALKPMLYGLESTEAIHPAWSPACGINIKTFLNKTRFSNSQYDLHDLFMKQLADQDGGINALLNDYAVLGAHGLTDPRIKTQIEKLDKSLEAVIRSPQWIAANALSHIHLPDAHIPPPPTAS